MKYCKYKPYNYLSKWIAGTFWLTGSISRNSNTTIVKRLKNIGEKVVIDLDSYPALKFKLSITQVKYPRLKVKIPIVERQRQTHTEATAVSSM
tara:strand:- start:12 stop:290 length:279 start_codon:yes stop_codon:yes gene_type:complete